MLSVSLDDPDEKPAFGEFTRRHGMTWPQIFDGGGWKTAVAAKYGIQGIPCPVLVDGDTGMILAEGPGALDKNLLAVLNSSLAAKAKK